MAQGTSVEYDVGFAVCIFLRGAFVPDSFDCVHAALEQ